MRVFYVIFIFSFLLAFSGVKASSGVDYRVSVQGGGITKPLIIYGHNPKTRRTARIKDCRLKCDFTLSEGETFHILLRPKSKRYKTYIRRNLEDSVLKDGVYRFNLVLKTPEEEERHYFAAQLADKVDKAKDRNCDTIKGLTSPDRVKSCYKVQPFLPPRMRRSGWCKVTLRVLTNGRTDDVKVETCSEDVFKISSEETVKLFRYFPKEKDGEIISSRLRTTVNFTLTDGKGNIIPPKVNK